MIRVFRGWPVCLLVALFPVLIGRQLPAASPQLSYILPPGVQRGQEQVLTFTGAHFKDAAEVLFYDPGVTVKKLEVVDPQNVKVTVDVAADCRLGEHLAHVRTKSGISDYRSFFVGALPNVDEKEPNNSFEEPQKIDLNVCVAGVLQNEDADYYRVQAKKGQRLSVEVEGIRLGQAYYDPYLAIMDKNRFELAAVDDTVLAKQDGFLSVAIPEDGEYTILVRESSYRGADNCRYRLHVGNFPRPSVAYPAGGKRGEQLKVQFIGDASGPIEQPVTVSADPKAPADVFVSDAQGITPSPVLFRAFSEGNVLETEPNDGFENATAAELPLAMNGRLEKPGDVDFFKFVGKKGQTWEVECYAHRVGSPVDPVVNIYRATDKAGLVGNDDARGQDSYMRWQVPDDGEYFIRVADHLNQGGPTYVYRIELTPVVPSLKIGIPRIDRYSQTRQTVVVPKGNRYGTLILATRNDFGGPLEILPANLLSGVKLFAQPMHPSLTLVPVVFEAAADAPVAGGLVDFRAKLADPKQAPIEGGFENVADFVLGEPNNAVYITCVVQKLAMSVADPVPYHIEIVQPKAPLVRGGTMNMKVLVKRDAGFDGPLTLQFPFNPPGVSSPGAINVDKGQKEAVYQLNANGDSMFGKWPMIVIGAAEMDGQAWVSSQLAELEVADRFVNFELKRASCDKGQTTPVQCVLTHVTPFEGKAKAEILGLPPGTTADSVEFTKDTKELLFQVKTTKDSPVGIHKSLFCQVSLTHNGDPVIYSTGGTELQVTEPPVAAPAPMPAPAAAAPAATPPPAPPTEKPLSRLEKLRLKAKQGK